MPLKGTTIGTYFRRAFLENIATTDGSKFDQIYKAHSARHAVASSDPVAGRAVIDRWVEGYVAEPQRVPS